MNNSDPIAERNALARQYQAQGDLGRAIALFEANLRECADLRGAVILRGDILVIVP